MLKLGLLHETSVISFGLWVVHIDHWDKSIKSSEQILNIVQPYFIVVVFSYIFLKLSCISLEETGQKIDRYAAVLFFGARADW
jgi:hypothetical protein